MIIDSLALMFDISSSMALREVLRCFQITKRSTRQHQIDRLCKWYIVVL